MSFTDWASALSKIVMAAASIVAILVIYAALRPAPPPPPLPDPDSAPCNALAEVEALRHQLEELKQRLTDLEELKERFVGALQ